MRDVYQSLEKQPQIGYRVLRQTSAVYRQPSRTCKTKGN
ncbi:hypothetical protein MICAD_70005 [Microcystis aeruginosa PCC 7941]|nr:hypothetical protein MICAD_70005 [Microcystis aeruginosa PCC 7941]